MGNFTALTATVSGDFLADGQFQVPGRIKRVWAVFRYATQFLSLARVNGEHKREPEIALSLRVQSVVSRYEASICQLSCVRAD